uniref:Uncharacterized protein n=1 Tax=Anguilla anguilla TaxID=7936 RepID=A0A0E9SV29_ANGAN
MKSFGIGVSGWMS